MLGGAAAGWPSAGLAQQKAMPLIGVLMSVAQSNPENQGRLRAFHEGLAALGWVEGRNLRLECRWAGGDEAQMTRHAAELVGLRPDIILANGTPAVIALKKATTTIPVVCALVQDPVGLGIVPNLARPGGNITGFTFVNPELIGKWSELLAEVAPPTRQAALLFNPSINPQFYDFLRGMEPARPGPARRRSHRSR